MTGHSKESTQLDVYSFRKMARNHDIIIHGIIRLPYINNKHPSLPLASKFSKGYFEKFLSLWAFIKTIGTVSGIRNRGS